MEKILLVEDDPTVADIILEYIRADARYGSAGRPAPGRFRKWPIRGFP